jgi:3-oxoacyl-[acyl-carrier protein] reductase
MNLGLKNKRVVIVGASRGLGREIANQFAKEGALLTLVARNGTQLKSIIKNLKKNNSKHNFIISDLKKKSEPTKVAKEILRINKKIDIVIHNLGGNQGSTAIFSNLDNWYDNWLFNVGIAIELNNVFGPHLIKNKWGRIVHVSSSNSTSGGTTSDGEAPAPAYTCAKSNLNMYSKVLGREMAKFNVIVSCVIPGAMVSKGKYWDRLTKTKPQIVNKYLKNHHAIGRFGKFSEVAPFILMLSSKYATYAAAANINLDGGYI